MKNDCEKEVSYKETKKEHKRTEEDRSPEGAKEKAAGNQKEI